MPEKNTYTLRIQYDNRTAFKAMVDDNNNWKSLDIHPSSARRRRIEHILKELKEVGEKLGPRMMSPAFTWYEARFAVAVQRAYRGSKMLSFTGVPCTMESQYQPGVVY